MAQREPIALPCGLTMQYWPEFLSEKRADELFVALQSAPWEQHHIKMFGRTIAEPRLSAVVGDHGIGYRYSKTYRQASPWPREFAELLPQVTSASSTPFNCALLNLYRNGEDSMGWHSDNEAELGKRPVVASMSLGAVRALKLKSMCGQHRGQISLGHGSLLLMPAGMQKTWQHSIAKSKTVNLPRINITFRQIIPILA